MKPSSTAFLLIIVMLLALSGFFYTYLAKFPEFASLRTAHHFHGAMMMSWFGMLIAQPLLITYKKNRLHRLFGKTSYAVAPLVVFSIYLVTRLEYYDDLSKYTVERSLAGLDLDLMSMFSFAVLYSLAIIYRHNMAEHMRYMICTGLLIFIPGLGRLFAVGFGLSGMITGILIMVITYGLYIGLIIYDWLKDNPVKPYVVGVTLVTLTNIVVANNKSGAWQWLAGKIAHIAF